MLLETCRVSGFIPQLSKVIRHGSLGVNKFFSSLPAENPQNELTRNTLERMIYKYPEFLPLPNIKTRNALKEKLERKDMLKRRSAIQIPEFYVGSILAVTTSNNYAPGKSCRFVGICIHRRDLGLCTTFRLRNVIEHQGVEILYSLYSPLIQKIEVLRLEKRLDDQLFYLRDAPNEYSTFPFDMMPEYNANKEEIPVNTTKVKLNPRPWLERYERMDLKGVELPPLNERLLEKAKKHAKPWEKYDLMDEYRRNITEEETKDIFAEICDELKELELKQKSDKRKKIFQKTFRQKLF